ncbi:hypothetical protein H4R22_001741 [Coemansia sp. RSA 1290]|nr:hypothetical protein H4R22_001741 [Coemansia sp. RSA 1290]
MFPFYVLSDLMEQLALLPTAKDCSASPDHLEMPSDQASAFPTAGPNPVVAAEPTAASTASTGYVSSVPAAAAPKLPPAPSTSAQPIAVTPIPVVIADFIYSPVAPAIPAAPTPASSAVYAAKAAPSVPSSAAPANPMPEPSMTMVPSPAPVPTSSQAYHAYANNKRSIDQDSLQGLVSGTNAMLFNVNENSYILTRLPLDLATKAAQNPSALRKRATENDMIADATTKDLGSDAVLYDLVGKIFARITLPINANVGISNPTEDGGLLKRDDLLENLLGEVVASAVAPVNIIANINPDEDGNGLVPNLLGRVSATIQASPTVTAHIFDSDKDDSGELLKRDDLGELLKRDMLQSGIHTERVDDAHVAIYVPLTALTKGQAEISQIVSAVGTESAQIVSMTATPTLMTSSAPTPAASTINNNIFLRIVIPASKLM